MVGLWFFGFSLHLIAIYLYTKFYLNSNISLKLFAVQGTGWTNGQTETAATVCFPNW